MRERRTIATRKTLLSRLKNWEDRESWKSFYDVYWRLIFGQAIAAGLNEDEAEEVAQDTVIEVSHRIQTFEYNPLNGSFRGWLFRLVRWRIANQFRKRRSGTVPIEFLASDSDAARTPEDQVLSFHEEPDAAWDREYRETIFRAALKGLRSKCDLKHLQVFDFLTVKQWSADEVAQYFHINTAHVYLIKYRITRLLKVQIARLEKEHWNICR
jgi:RNA polymerase sigma-70 factor (ECF subfamily)